MPRTMPAGLAAHLAGLATPAFRADLWTLTALDATVYRWTSAELNITTGGNTFLTQGTSAPLVKRGPYRQNFLPIIDTLDVTVIGGAFLIAGKALPLQAALGYFDGARLQLDHLVGADLPTALSFGPILKFFEGRVATVSPQGPAIRFQIRSEADALNQLVPQFLLQPACGNAVYDANCGLSRAAFTLTGAASGVPTTTTVPTASAALTAKPAGHFDLGVLSFTSGVNNNVRAAIQSWSANTFTLALPLSVAPAAGDTISVYPGCPRTKSSCGPLVLATATGGTVNTVTTTNATIIAKPNGYYIGVNLQITSGTQSGQVRQIVGFTVSGGTATFFLAAPNMPGSPANGDTFTVNPGGKFDNWVQFRGYPHVPSPESGGM